MAAESRDSHRLPSPRSLIYTIPEGRIVIVVSKQVLLVLVAVFPLPGFHMRINKGNVDISTEPSPRSPVVPPPRLAPGRYTNGKVLMLGVDYESSTYIHVVEAIDWDRRLAADPTAEYHWLKRPELGQYWEGLGQLNRGRIGDADSRLFSIRAYVDTLLEEVELNRECYKH